jgi:hypothetical protein
VPLFAPAAPTMISSVSPAATAKVAITRPPTPPRPPAPPFDALPLPPPPPRPPGAPITSMVAVPLAGMTNECEPVVVNERTHLPSMQGASGQTTPHLPQLFASMVVLVSQLRSPTQSAKPGLQLARRQVPPSQSGTPFWIAQTFPHAPQLFTSVSRSN